MIQISSYIPTSVFQTLKSEGHSNGCCWMREASLFEPCAWYRITLPCIFCRCVKVLHKTSSSTQRPCLGHCKSRCRKRCSKYSQEVIYEYLWQ